MTQKDPKTEVVSSGSLLGWAVVALFALIGIVYGTLVTADNSQKADITNLKDDHIIIGSRLQRIEGNIFQICKDINAQDCLPPIPAK